MNQSAKALMVVIVLMGGVLLLARPICLHFMEAADFDRRRKVWIALTVSAFLVPSFWLYLLVAAPLLAWLGTKDKNPLAVYLLFIYVIPPWGFPIPTIGINQLFDMTQMRLLAMVLLIPAAVRVLQSNDASRKLTAVDFFILAYGLVQLTVYIPYESPTNTVRRAILFMLDIYLPLYVAQRCCRTRSQIVDAMAAYCLSCALFTPVAVFESLKTWVLYQDMGGYWGYEAFRSYLLRGSTLRAQASTGHALTLGSVMAMGFGFWLYLKSRVRSSMTSSVVLIWMWLGLLAAYSRGPWLTAGVLYFLFLLFHPAGSSRFFKGLFIVGLTLGLLLLSPIGDRIVDNLPFVGSVDQQNVTYRQRLAETSMMLIKRNPFFGDPFVLLQMEDLRQGEGIIDLMNAYAAIALFYGLVGLSLFFAIYVIGLWNAIAAVWRNKRADADLALLGACLVACTLGTMFFMATAGSTAIQYVLVGMLASYAALTPNSRQAPLDAPQEALIRPQLRRRPSA
jgi:hypothetical protein